MAEGTEARNDSSEIYIKKLLIKLLIFSAVILALYLVTHKTAADGQPDANPIINNETNNKIPAETPPANTAPVPKSPGTNKGVNLKSDHKGDPAKLQTYLEAQKSKYQIGSPLAPYAPQIAKSDFWALIIGICTIEQYNCTHASNWNFWGMGPGMKFSSAEEAISYMDAYFTRLYVKKQTVESLRGYYCASACTNWESTVLKVKAELENK